MDYKRYLITNPFFWIFLAGLFFGAALKSATIIPSRKSNPEKARRNKWFFFCIYASLAVAAALGGIFIPGPDRILDLRLAFVFAAVSTMAAAGLRFKRACGIPLLCVGLLCSFAVLLYMRNWIAVTEGEIIARVRILSSVPAETKIEVFSSDGIPIAKDKPKETSWFLSLKGESFAPIIDILRVPDLLFFFGGTDFFRLSGFESYAGGGKNDGDAQRGVLVPVPRSEPTACEKFIEPGIVQVPGIVHYMKTGIPVRYRVFDTYALRYSREEGALLVKD